MLVGGAVGEAAHGTEDCMSGSMSGGTVDKVGRLTGNGGSGQHVAGGGTHDCVARMSQSGWAS